MNVVKMLQANHFFLTLLPLIIYHVNSVPISPTITPRSDCRVDTPSKPTLHDLGCVRDAFDQIHSSLMAHNILLQQQPQCSPNEVITHALREPLRVLHALKQNVDRLECINTSLVNASYSEYICRMRSVLLPSLSHTTTTLCRCTNINCNYTTERNSDSCTTEREDDSTEFCVVNAIRVTLKSLLKRLDDDSRVTFSEDDLQCRVNFTSRQQVVNVKEKISSIKTFCPDHGLPISSSLFCKIREDLNTLQGASTLFRNKTDSEMQNLADDIEGVIPHFQDILESQLLAGENENCSISSNSMATESDKTCVPIQLKRSYNSLVKVATRNLELSCSEVYIQGVSVEVEKLSPPTTEPPSSTTASKGKDGDHMQS